MSTSFDKILNSRTFQFLVGPDRPDRTPYTIHTAVVSDHSAPLTALMNGLMREASDGIAELEDIDEQTFVSFCEYAYMGDYTPAQHQLVPAISTVNRAENSSPTSTRTVENYGSRNKKMKRKSAGFDSIFSSGSKNIEKSCGQCGREAPPEKVLWDEFKHRDYSMISPKYQPREELEESEKIANLFLFHARVYVFADRYNIAGLRTLALDKLHKTLCAFKAEESQMGAIMDLVRYSYSNDNTRENEVGQDRDDLRSMVVEFVVCFFETMLMEDGFPKLMEEGGCFPRDLAVLLGKRSIVKPTKAKEVVVTWDDFQ